MTAPDDRRVETPYQRDADYPRRYRDERFRTGSGPATHRREVRAIRRLLRRASWRDGPWLDVPCGAGRMSDLLPGPPIGVDRAVGMLAAGGPARPSVCASASALPFPDATFAGALCHRLLHHIPTSEERVRILMEIARVTDGPLVVSFFHAPSLQHARRLIARQLGKPTSGRGAITLGRFLGDLRAAGLRPRAFEALLPFVSEQWLVLAERAAP